MYIFETNSRPTRTSLQLVPRCNNQVVANKKKQNDLIFYFEKYTYL